MFDIESAEGVIQFKKALRERIAMRGWNLEEASRQIGVPVCTLRGWFQTRTKPSARTMYELDGLLGLRLFQHDCVNDEFFREKGVKKRGLD